MTPAGDDAATSSRADVRAARRQRRERAGEELRTAPRRVRRQLLQQILPFLSESGWLASMAAQEPVDRDGSPIPWITYPALDFLARRIRPDMRVFEFGSGTSTIWWSHRVESVTAVEHDPEWVERVRPRLPDNATVDHLPLDTDGAYCRRAREEGVRYDIIVIDGRDRVNCALQSVDALAPDGVMLWDNTDRRRYASGLDALWRLGFRQLAFTGLTPLDSFVSETSVLYRSGNCLDI